MNGIKIYTLSVHRALPALKLGKNAPCLAASHAGFAALPQKRLMQSFSRLTLKPYLFSSSPCLHRWELWMQNPFRKAIG